MRWIRKISRGRLHADQRGAAGVEMALIATPLFLFLFGIMEWGRYMYAYNTVQFACEQAARYGIMHISVANAAVEIRNFAQAEMGGLDFPNSEPVVTIDPAANTVEVVATIPFDFIIDFVLPFDVNVVGRAKM